MKKILGTTSSHSLFRWRIGYIRNGKRQMVTDWRNNLILDSGLNQIASVNWCQAFSYCLFGDQISPDPVERNSGGVTFTTVGTACTASGAFFEAGDVGRLIKFDDTDGQEAYITNFNSSTSVDLGSTPSPAISAETGTIWYVNQTALQSLYAFTNTYGATGGDNSHSLLVNVATNKRTFTGAAIIGSPVTLTEIGFSSNNSNINIFDRDIIPGGITLLVGDIPLAVCELVTTWNHITTASVGNVCTGFDSSGDSQLCGLNGFANQGISIVQTDGLTSGPVDNVQSIGSLEPCIHGAIDIALADFSIPAFINSYNGNLPSNTAQNSNTGPGYGSGNFYIDQDSNWNISSGVGTIYGFGIQCNGNLFQQHFTTPFTKLGTQTLTLRMRKMWQRVLTN